MKAFMLEQEHLPTVYAPGTREDPAMRLGTSPAPRGPIEFRFMLSFAPQMSTPCSRGLGIIPRSDDLLSRPAPRMFQSHLQRHGVLQS